MRAELSAVEVERPLVIGRGWLEFGLGADIKNATGYWSSTGDAMDFENASWLYTTERLDIRYGIARRGELYWNVPFHYVNLSNDALGTDTSDFGIGDPRFGWKREWFRRDAPLTSVVTDLQFKMPTGKEAPATYVGGPNTVTGFVLSTGTLDAALYLRAKQQAGPLAFTGSVGYVHKFSSVTQYVLEVEEYQFLGRFKPGDEVQAGLEVMAQLGPIALSGDALYRMRMVAEVGTTSDGILPDKHLDPIAGTDGQALDVTPALTVNITRGFDFRAAVGIPVMGEDLMFWPLEELTPTRGMTYSGTIELRY